MDKELWYIYTMEYYSAIKRNAFESFLMRQMNLEPIIQSDVSHKEKNKVILFPLFPHLYTIEYYSAIKRNAFESVLMR